LTRTEPTQAPAVVTVVGELADPEDNANTSPVSGDLLPTARLYADSHYRTHGEPINPAQLGLRMRIPSTEAARLLAAINDTANPYDRYKPTPAITGLHNGSRPLQDVNA
jgi:hypothetical protein